MARVVIVGKTKKKNKRCVGALRLRDNRNYRLLTTDGNDFPANTDFQLGQVWDLDLKKDSNLTPPHTEDHRIIHQRLVRTLSTSDLKRFLQDRVNAPIVAPRQLFDGKLHIAQNKKAYIWPDNKGLTYSTGFWRFRKALHIFRADYGRLRYAYCEIDISCNPDDDDLKLDVPYVGCEPAIDEIPADTILRFSLARWEDKPCYLMLSGWFL